MITTLSTAPLGDHRQRVSGVRPKKVRPVGQRADCSAQHDRSRPLCVPQVRPTGGRVEVHPTHRGAQNPHPVSGHTQLQEGGTHQTGDVHSDQVKLSWTIFFNVHHFCI